MSHSVEVVSGAETVSVGINSSLIPALRCRAIRGFEFRSDAKVSILLSSSREPDLKCTKTSSNYVDFR